MRTTTTAPPALRRAAVLLAAPIAAILLAGCGGGDGGGGITAFSSITAGNTYVDRGTLSSGPEKGSSYDLNFKAVSSPPTTVLTGTLTIGNSLPSHQVPLTGSVDPKTDKYKMTGTDSSNGNQFTISGDTSSPQYTVTSGNGDASTGSIHQVAQH